MASNFKVENRLKRTEKSTEPEFRKRSNAKDHVNEDKSLIEKSKEMYSCRHVHQGDMLELGLVRKNKINLSDYDCQQDIERRILVADLSFFEHEVLQEIFFSPLKFSLKKFAKNFDSSESAVLAVLQKLSSVDLLSIEQDLVSVDKDVRKFFEFHLKRFEDDFKPDMEYLQGILRKVPIHLLTSWYAIPRTSNNIFESIVEKYLFTPQIFRRYLNDLNLGNPVAQRIVQDVFESPKLSIASCDLITKYNLSRKEFEEIVLLLEFSFVCCLSYTKGEDLWQEWLTPFQEWRDYLLFFKETQTASIPKDKTIERKRKEDFAFVQDLEFALACLEAKNPSQAIMDKISCKDPQYVDLLIKKLLLLELAVQTKTGMVKTPAAESFIALPLEKRAIYLYRHPFNKIVSQETATEKNIREAEKSVLRALKQDWVFFDEFAKGSVACIGDDQSIALKKLGKTWKYTLPQYTEKEYSLLKATVLQWLFETGMVAPGICEERDCFTLTPFGRLFFEM